VREGGPPLLGRARELAILAGAVDEAASGHGRSIVLEGEAGAGKTRLLDEALDAAAQRDFTVVRGAAEEIEQTRPFGLLARAFALDPRSGDAERAAIGALLSGAAPVGGLAVLSQIPELRFRALESVLTLVEGLAVRRPLALGLDDLHWADPSTLLTVAALARRVSTMPILLIGTMRSPPASVELEAALDVLAPGSDHLVLGPLASEAVERLVAELHGGRPPPELLGRVAAAGGNPFFVIELVAGLGDDAAATGSLSPSLQRTVLRRIRHLPPDAAGVLQLAAVLGSSVSVRDLSQLTGRSPVELLDPVQASVRAGLLVEASGRLAFRHDLVREALYHDIPVSLQAALHREAGRALAAIGAPAAQVAGHFAASASPGDTEAVSWLRRAARESTAHAPETAVGLLERALELADAPDGQPGALRAELADALFAAGRHERVEAVAREALRYELDSEAAGRMRVRLTQALLLDGRLTEAAEELDRLDEHPELTGHRARLLVEAALSRALGWDLPRAGTLADEALSLARAQSDREIESIALYVQSWVHYFSGEYDRAIELGRDAVALADDTPGGHGHRHHPCLFLGVVLSHSDRADEAADVLRRGRALADGLGTAWDPPMYHAATAQMHLRAGDWDDAVAEAEASLAFTEELGTRLGIVWPLSFLGYVKVRRGDRAEAERAVARAEAEVAALGPRFGFDWMIWVRALLTESAGEPTGALAGLGQLWDLLVGLGIASQYQHFGPEVVRLALVCGDGARAAAVAATVEAAAPTAGSPSYLGAALRCRGLVDGDPDALVAAVAAYRRGSRRPETAAAEEDAGLALARAGRHEEAIAFLDAALELYKAVGARLDEERLVSGAAGVRLRRRRPARPRPTFGWDSLTRTERAVVALVGEGLTNAEIARRLVVSRRTVESHLYHVFTKLGVSSRLELALRADERRQ
jgi:DNA-binding CsgD family transcriptional regulator